MVGEETLLLHFMDAGLPSLAVIVAAIIANRKLDRIHILVNSRLTEALDEIAYLKARIGVGNKKDFLD